MKDESSKQSEIIPTAKVTKIDDLTDIQIRPNIANETLGDTLARVAEPVGEILVALMQEQGTAQARVAEIQKPIQQKQLELREQEIKLGHEQYLKDLEFKTAAEKRNGWFSFSIIILILTFLVAAGCAFIYLGDKQIAMSIVTLLVGLVTGFLGGAGWKSSQTKDEKE